MIDADRKVKVVVFDSNVENFFIAHFDVASGIKEPEIPRTGIAYEWGQFVLRMAQAPVVSIAEIRGRVRGHGSEFVLACDMRFASTEKAILGQPEAGFGLYAGGGSHEWLPRVVGRSRTLEILLGADDVDAKTAEMYGYINRAVADSELKGFVDNLARRIAGFEKQTLLETKRAVNARAGLPTEADLSASMETFFRSLKWPETAARYTAVYQLRHQLGEDYELQLGKHMHQVSMLVAQTTDGGKGKDTDKEGGNAIAGRL